MKGAFSVLPNSPFARIIKAKSPVPSADLTADGLLKRNPDAVTWAERGARTYLLVPLLKENELSESSPFSATECSRSRTARLIW